MLASRGKAADAYYEIHSLARMTLAKADRGIRAQALLADRDGVNWATVADMSRTLRRLAEIHDAIYMEGDYAPHNVHAAHGHLADFQAALEVLEDIDAAGETR
jgi:hypothetical protein